MKTSLGIWALGPMVTRFLPVGYQPQWAVSTWLYRILTNVCVDELRRRASRIAYDAGQRALEPARPCGLDRGCIWYSAVSQPLPRPASHAGTWICIARSRACRGRRAFSWRSATRRGSPTESSRRSAASPSIP